MDYVSFAVRTENKDYDGIKSRIDGRTIRLLHGVMGISTEVGEIHESEDSENLKEELGDLMWYVALLCHEAPFSLDEIEERVRFAIGPDTKIPDQLFFVFERALVRGSGRLVDALKKSVFYGKHLDLYEFQDDLVDVVSNVMKSCRIFGINYEDMKSKNIDKLRARYPNKFTENDAINRDLDKEKGALEGEAK